MKNQKYLNKRRAHVIVPVLATVLYALIGAAGRHTHAGETGVTPLIAALCDSGRVAVEEARYSEAEYFFWTAYDLGMSEDSLYYFLSHTAMSRDAVDTALTYNLYISDSVSAALHQATLEQRYLLYSMAGLEEDAAAVFSLLGSFQGPSPKSVFSWKPDFRLYSQIGCWYEAPDYARWYPYRDVADSGVSREYRGRVSSALSWRLPDLAERTQYSSLLFKGDNDYGQVGIEYLVSGLLPDIALALRSQYKRYFGSDDYITYSAEVSRFGAWRKSYMLLSITYDYETEDFPALQSQDCIGLMVWGRQVKPALEAGMTLMGTIYAGRSDPGDSTYNFLRRMFVYDVDNGEHLHASDSTFSDSIMVRDPVFGIPMPQRNPQAYKDSAKSFSYRVASRIPVSYISVEAAPMVSWTMPLGITIDTEIGGSWRYYLQDHAWTDFGITFEGMLDSLSYDPMVVDTGTPPDAGSDTVLVYYIVQNGVDGRLYWGGRLENPGGAVYYGPIRTYEKRRIDITVSARFAVDIPVFEWLSFGAQTHVRKTWSTLAADAPEEIPDTEFGLQLTANLRL